MAESHLLIDVSDGIATLTLNRPEKMNALSRALRRELAATFRRLDGDDDVGVAILTGAGRAFTAGLDLKELSGTGMGDAVEGGDADVVGAMHAFRKPIIGAINGVAVTGGFEIALACDILIASSEARFADTHARVGILPGWGLSQKLPRMIGISRAKELSLTGNYLSAEQAERWGLVNRVVAPDELLSACRKIAEDILSCVPGVPAIIKGLIDEGYATTFEEGRRMEAKKSAAHARTVTAEAIAERRSSVQSRGRSQKA